MLVLKRREGEEIIVAEEIRIRILYADNGTARIGIEAPREVPIRRAEIPAAEEVRKTVA